MGQFLKTLDPKECCSRMNYFEQNECSFENYIRKFGFIKP
ncbi:hypothetical protein LEP1GSC016_3598 [Leptospira borgpetersenii serovar Hardjo-bovis str. Sponselee]|uniref:Uncharacterized protein n=1 Tax=Leptospira borgpetersenii serovar Hardjo-bovis str. Sponselee TaxID=1303729 RepID=M6BM86_LEPBO|nr:hypothetical protein LEP1GSC016_3598 [Leptospira borgpetersenii serovar Hardjo-bovis str. Sponselee]